MPNPDFAQAVAPYRDRTDAYLREACDNLKLGPDHLAEAVCSYLQRPAKRLRPALLLLCCEAVGGEVDRAVPAAAAVELFHTWTLVHDDIIDNDPTRRGAPTAHVAAAARGAADFGLRGHVAAAYGRHVAILAGDLQQAWSVQLLSQCAERGVSETVVLALIRDMVGALNPALIEGEMRDVQCACRSAASLTEDELLRMMRLKTGVLLGYAAAAGAAIGLDCPPRASEVAQGLREFAELCGVAFQLQDDILGIMGDPATLGKPVGSDIREGKVTLLVLHALTHGDATAKRVISETLGDPQADDRAVGRVRECIVAAGAVDSTRDLARKYLKQAVQRLDDTLSPSQARSLLRSWADRMIERSF